MSRPAVLAQGKKLAAVPSIGRAVGVERRRVAAPEADATRSLFERHSRQIYNYCLHQLSSREEAEDAVQTTFMNAFRGLKRGVVPEAEQAWLFKIAENVCLSRRRSSWRRGRVETPNDFEVLQEIVPSRRSGADELIGLEDALEAMPESQRRAILLREWQGLSYREIADELDISQAAVETLIFRARRALAQGLEEPPAPKRARSAGRGLNGINAGTLLASLKSLLTGAAAVKAVAVAVAAGTATFAATEAPKIRHHATTASAKRTVRQATHSKPDAAPLGLVATQPTVSPGSAHRAGRVVAPADVHRGRAAGPGASSSAPVSPPTAAAVEETSPAAAPPAVEPKHEDTAAAAAEPAGNGHERQNQGGGGKKQDRTATPQQAPAPSTGGASQANAGANDPGEGEGKGKSKDGAASQAQAPAAAAAAPAPPPTPPADAAQTQPQTSPVPTPPAAEEHGKNDADHEQKERAK